MSIVDIKGMINSLGSPKAHQGFKTVQFEVQNEQNIQSFIFNTKVKVSSIIFSLVVSDLKPLDSTIYLIRNPGSEDGFHRLITSSKKSKLECTDELAEGSYTLLVNFIVPKVNYPLQA
jgi:hypothetical protein